MSITAITTAMTTAQIQAALDANDYCLFDSGTFTLTAGLVLNRDGARVEGSGPLSTIVKMGNGLNVDVFKGPAATSRFFVRIANLRIDGNKANNSSGHALNMLGFHTCLVDNLHILNAADTGIIIQGDASHFALNNKVTNCRVESSRNTAIKVAGFAPNNHIGPGNVLGGTDNFSCMEVQNDETLIIGNHMNSAASHGIDVGGRSTKICNNIIESCGGHGVNVGSGSTFTQITDYAAFNHGQSLANAAAIRVDGSRTIIMSAACYNKAGNSTQKYGIDISASASQTLLLGCDLGSNAIDGLRDLGAGTTLLGNDITPGAKTSRTVAYVPSVRSTAGQVLQP